MSELNRINQQAFAFAKANGRRAVTYILEDEAQRGRLAYDLAKAGVDVSEEVTEISGMALLPPPVLDRGRTS